MKLKSVPKIFVVEDNILYQRLIARELESISDDIHFYTTGEACIKELHKNPVIIILDYNLDGKMTGLDTLQSVRICNPVIPAILFSSQADLHSTENQVRYGQFEFLEKCDHSFKKLKHLINRALAFPCFA